MLEIAVFSLIIIGVAGLLLMRRKKPRPDRHKPEVFECPVCGEKDCHCERRS